MVFQSVEERDDFQRKKGIRVDVLRDTLQKWSKPCDDLANAVLLMMDEYAYKNRIRDMTSLLDELDKHLEAVIKQAA